MELKFREDIHKYESIDDPDKVWLSVTGIVKLFKEPFDQQLIAGKATKNKKSQWYGMDVDEVVDIWNKESKRALSMGTWYHNQREAEVIAHETIQREGVDLTIFHPHEDEGGIRFSPDQQLGPGIYPEHFMYLTSAGICGQADRVEVIGDRIDLFDYKTNKEIKTKSYTNWQGVSKKLLAPMHHMDDCHLMHYALQMSLYMYIMLKHNPGLKPGKVAIHHVLFEVEKYDDYGYPSVIATDPGGDPIVKEVVPYEVPYMKREVNNIIKYLKSHPELFVK